jgi:hypothetical protein
MARLCSTGARVVMICFCSAIIALNAGILNASEPPSARKLDWQDLLPQAQQSLESALLEQQRAVWSMSDEQREGYYDVAYEMSVREGIEDGSIKPADVTDDDRAVLAKMPSKTWPEAIAYWKRVAEIRKQLEEQSGASASELDGRAVRIPGYVLPLEFDGAKVTEFLLVPYVGACIHAPVPPANQIVVVKASAAFDSAGLYAPVWIEGVLRTGKSQKSLELVDGQAPIDAAYLMDAAVVRAYKK